MKETTAERRARQRAAREKRDAAGWMVTGEHVAHLLDNEAARVATWLREKGHEDLAAAIEKGDHRA